MSQLRTAQGLVHGSQTSARAMVMMLASMAGFCLQAEDALAQSASTGQTQGMQAERVRDNGAMRRRVPQQEKPKRELSAKPAAPTSTTPPAQPESQDTIPASQAQPALSEEATTQTTEASKTPPSSFMMRGVAMRGLSFGVGFEYAWFGRMKSVTLRSYSGGSDGIRVLSLPAGAKTAELADGTKVRWQAIGELDGDPSLVSDEDFKQFQALMPGANEAKAMHKYVATDESAKWELQYTLATPLHDNSETSDWIPELIVAFAAQAKDADQLSGITVVALDGAGKETGTPIALRVSDARETTPVLRLAHINASGVTEGAAQPMLATVDLSRLGVLRTSSLLVRPTRAGDALLSGEQAGGRAAPVPFKLIAVETAGMPLPTWATGD